MNHHMKLFYIYVISYPNDTSTRTKHAKKKYYDLNYYKIL